MEPTINEWATVKTLMQSDTNILDIVEALSRITDEDMIQCMHQESPDDYYLWDLLHFALDMNRPRLILLIELYFSSSSFEDEEKLYLYKVFCKANCHILDIIKRYRSDENQALDWTHFLGSMIEGK